MTPELRLDRLERLARLFVRAGIRYRRDLRELGDKLNIMVNMQIKNDERFARNQERFARNEERFARREERNEERFARNEARLVALSERTDRRFLQLADSQAQTDRSLAELIKIVRTGHNGNPQPDS
jgi:predicted nuclease with TOPRIM domain